jgi:hypothetical protein
LIDFQTAPGLAAGLSSMGLGDLRVVTEVRILRAKEQQRAFLALLAFSLAPWREKRSGRRVERGGTGFALEASLKTSEGSRRPLGESTSKLGPAPLRQALHGAVAARFAFNLGDHLLPPIT